MKRGIEWVDKIEGGIKRKVRVSFLGQGKIKWQFKCSDEPLWDYDSLPTSGDWDTLEEKIDALYNRRRAAYKDLELVRQEKKKSAAQ